MPVRGVRPVFDEDKMKSSVDDDGGGVIGIYSARKISHNSDVTIYSVYVFL